MPCAAGRVRSVAGRAARTAAPGIVVAAVFGIAALSGRVTAAMVGPGGPQVNWPNGNGRRRRRPIRDSGPRRAAGRLRDVRRFGIVIRESGVQRARKGAVRRRDVDDRICCRRDTRSMPAAGPAGAWQGQTGRCRESVSRARCLPRCGETSSRRRPVHAVPLGARILEVVAQEAQHPVLVLDTGKGMQVFVACALDQPEPFRLTGRCEQAPRFVGFGMAVG